MVQDPRTEQLGSWIVVLSNDAIGRAGEYQAASIFELHGITTTHVDVKAVDLWVETPSGRRVTVQVKSSLGPRPLESGRKNPRYKFHLHKQTTCAMADVFCFVALDLGCIRLCSSAELARGDQMFHARDMNRQMMLEDIKRYLY